MQNPPTPYSIIGSTIVELDETSSTNVFANELLKNAAKPEEGTCIFTEYQSAGRGQMQSGWESQKSANLLFSLILYPEFLRPEQQFFLNQAISLGIYDCLIKLIPSELFIKWPNDIYAGNNKIAGILIENTIQGPGLRQSVVGIGLNVNQEVFSFKGNPTSLKLVAGREFNRKHLRKDLLSCLNNRYLQLRRKDLERLSEDYSRALFRMNQPYLFDLEGELQQGTIRGVNELGQLKVELGQDIRYFNFKEIKYLHELWS